MSCSAAPAFNMGQPFTCLRCRGSCLPIRDTTAVHVGLMGHAPGSDGQCLTDVEGK